MTERKRMIRVYWTLAFGDVDFSNRLWATRSDARTYKREAQFTEGRIVRVEVREVPK